MAVVKVYCSRCGQRVSGDENFFGTTVQCPVCSSEIHFPKGPESESLEPHPATIPPPPRRDGSGLHSGGVTAPMPGHPLGALPVTGGGRFPPALGSSLPVGPTGAHGLPAGPLAGPPMGATPAAAGPMAASKSAASQPEERPGGKEDPGVMPTLVLGSGIASMILCSGFLVLSAVAIVGGHLTMIKLDRAGIKEGRNQVVAGTLLGYCSVALFLLVAIGVYFWLAWERK